MGFAPTRNARLSTAHAGNRLTTYRAARSALPAVVPDPAGSYRESGKTGLNGGNSRPIRPLHARTSPPERAGQYQKLLKEIQEKLANLAGTVSNKHFDDLLAQYS